MSNENIISWNVPNWITIFLMVLVMYALLAVIAQAFKKKGGGSGGKRQKSDKVDLVTGNAGTLASQLG